MDKILIYLDDPVYLNPRNSGATVYTGSCMIMHGLVHHVYDFDWKGSIILLLIEALLTDNRGRAGTTQALSVFPVRTLL